ncbi:MAG TPA: TspO/MBR family protein [Gammaproteobacteria bacterium]|nr:TspO/MBR family protein [Gammaproteobacteria bacterium]
MNERQSPGASLAIFAALVIAAALTGMLFQPGEWYASLDKPSWTPPVAAFDIAWTLLYIAIAFAGWLEWRGAEGRADSAVIAWGAQLILNAAWSWLFFGLHRIGLAFIDILLLLIAIIAFMITARSRIARWLFLPYALWVTFAGALNFSILLNN